MVNYQDIPTMWYINFKFELISQRLKTNTCLGEKKKKSNFSTYAHNFYIMSDD